MWLLFLRDQASIFNRTVKAVESDNINAMEVGHALNSFVQSFESRKKSIFVRYSAKGNGTYSAVDERVSKEEMQDLSRQFYESCIKYIEKWKEQFDHIMIFAWCALDQPPKWKFIETTAKYSATNNHFDLESSDTDLFDQFTYLERYVTEEKIQSWEENGTATDQRWAHQPPLNEYFL
ncbi:uncharacterized protein LOC120780693 [Bactrocera tryoni]|uniref:uncharacterized protein LOC120780693 n=1 Tax=Bactrocera tryoni TaxID=59916 RepID=UPI001A96B7A8|nr:uncharacterized protein LOC120780693 [Bactrocera tryoni]